MLRVFSAFFHSSVAFPCTQRRWWFTNTSLCVALTTPGINFNMFRCMLRSLDGKNFFSMWKVRASRVFNFHFEYLYVSAHRCLGFDIWGENIVENFFFCPASCMFSLLSGRVLSTAIILRVVFSIFGLCKWLKSGSDTRRNYRSLSMKSRSGGLQEVELRN